MGSIFHKIFLYMRFANTATVMAVLILPKTVITSFQPNAKVKQRKAMIAVKRKLLN